MPQLPPEVTAIKDRMTAFSPEPFPDSCDGLTVDGVLVEYVDTCLVGCISAFVKNRGELDDQRHEVLKTVLSELDRIQDRLPEDAASYFGTLGDMGREVLRLLP